MRSTIKVFQVLETLCMDNPAGVAELSSRLAVKRSSMHRFLSVLTHQGYVEKNANTGKYCATLKVFQLGVSVRNKLSLIHLARPYMEELGRKFHETINLSLFIENSVVVIDRVESLETLRIDHGIGRRLPAYCTALGKVFLANLAKEELEKYCEAQKLQAFTKRTVTSSKELKRDLKSVREEGFAIDDREVDDGIRCISAPIRDGSGKVVAAISISGPSTRVTLQRLKSFKRPIINLTAEISRKLGYG